MIGAYSLFSKPGSFIDSGKRVVGIVLTLGDRLSADSPPGGAPSTTNGLTMQGVRFVWICVLSASRAMVLQQAIGRSVQFTLIENLGNLSRANSDQQVRKLSRAGKTAFYPHLE